MEAMDVSPDSTPKSTCDKDGQELKSPSRDTESSPQRSGAKSPDTNCSICLGKFDNKSFTDACFHTFCFVCILEWSKVKATCPLCKTSFKSIIHNIQSNEMYDQYYLPPMENGSIGVGDRDMARFRYRTTLTEARRSLMAQRRNLMLTRSRYRSHRRRLEAAAFEKRRLVYAFGLRAKQSATRKSTRLRDISAAFYRANPACVHRLVPWLQREMSVLFTNNDSHVKFMTAMVLSYVSQVDMESEEFKQYLRPFLYHRTEQFVSELISFARSLHNMAAYDQLTYYDYPNMNQRAEAAASGDIPLIALSPDGTSSSSDNSIISPVESIPGLASTWVFGGNAPRDLPSTSATNLLSTHNPEPPAGAAQAGPSGTADSDSDDVIFVGFVKPPGERTPQAIIELSSDPEVKSDDERSPGKSGQVAIRRSRDEVRNRRSRKRSHQERSSSSEWYNRRGQRSSSYSDSCDRSRNVMNKPGGKRKQKTKHVRKSKYQLSDHLYHKSKRDAYTTETDSDYELPQAYSSRTYKHSRRSLREYRSRSRSRSRSPSRDYRYRSRTTRQTFTYDTRDWRGSSSSSIFSKMSTSTSHTGSRTGHSYYERDSRERSRSNSRGRRRRNGSKSRSRSPLSHGRSCSVEFMGSFSGGRSRSKHSRTSRGHRRSNTYCLTDTDTDIEVTHVKKGRSEERSRRRRKHKHHKRKHRHGSKHKKRGEKSKRNKLSRSEVCIASAPSDSAQRVCDADLPDAERNKDGPATDIVPKATVANDTDNTEVMETDSTIVDCKQNFGVERSSRQNDSEVSQDRTDSPRSSDTEVADDGHRNDDQSLSMSAPSQNSSSDSPVESVCQSVLDLVVQAERERLSKLSKTVIPEN